MTTVLICGSRTWTDYATIRAALINALHGEELIIHGGCPTGADAMAGRLATKMGFPVTVYHADWKSHGKAAGPIRNQRMLDDGKPYLVIAFWDGASPGTKDMIERAKKARVQVRIIYAEGCSPVQGSLL